MTISDNDLFATRLKNIAEKLNACEGVRKHDREGEKQGWTLAHSFLDLAESFQSFLNLQLPVLLEKTLDCEEINALLFEIGEEFRHIQYHIRDAEFYAYLRD